MKGETHFGKDENLPLRYAYFHVHFNLRLKNNNRFPNYRHEEFHLWVSPAKEAEFPKSILEDSWRLMINDESMWNFLVNENHYDIFSNLFEFGAVQSPQIL